MRTKKRLLVGWMLLGIMTSKAQTVTIDGEIRPRIEFKDGFNKPLLQANDPGVVSTQRTRLNLLYKTALMSTGITLQDARTFGQNPVQSDVATVGIYEAWSELLLMPGTTFKIGRQTLTYDDRRLFSSPQWSNTGTSHDIGLLKLALNDFQAHVGLAYNNNTAITQETYYTPVNKYRYLNFVWLSKEITKGLSITATAVDEGVQDTMVIKAKNYKKTAMNHAYTYGGNIKLDRDSFPITAFATAYFQGGEDEKGLKLNGKLLALKLGYKATNYLSFSVGTDYLSGDNNSTDNLHSNFKKLYGADHYFNGYMEYWRTPLNEGLLDYYGACYGKINEVMNVECGYHLFNSDKKLTYNNSLVGKSLGSEVDLILNYKLNEYTNIQAGYCKYFTTDNTLSSKGIAPTAATVAPQWAYIMFTIKPTFLK